MRTRAGLMAVMWFGAGSVAVADPAVTVAFDPALSSVDAELCLLNATGCDTDSSPVTGFAEIRLDDNGSPGNALLIDFDLSLTQTLNHNISLGLLGSFDSTSENVQIRSALMAPAGPAAVTGGMATFMGVAAEGDGTVTYNSSGLVCTGLQGSGLPCADTLALSSFPAGLADIEAQIASAQVMGGHEITVTLTLNQRFILDETDPTLATLDVLGVATGTVFAPTACAGDADGNGVVDVNDITFVVSNLGETGIAGLLDGDVDGNGAVDVNDITFVVTRLGVPCP